MSNGRFDVEAFYAALDTTRERRGLSWKQAARDAGVSPSTLTRMGQGKHPDANSLAALLAWSGLGTAEFLGTHTTLPAPDPVAQISAYLRADKNLTPETVEAIEQVIRATYDLVRKQRRSSE